MSWGPSREVLRHEQACQRFDAEDATRTALDRQRKREAMNRNALTILIIVLLLLWLGGWLVVPVGGDLVHLLLVIILVVVVIRLLRGGPLW
jgi:hypothetical protein